MNDQRKSEKVVYVLAILVIVIAVICSIVPLVTKGEIADKNIMSTFGTEVTLYGKGIYAMNSYSSAVQAIAQDMVTLILVVPGMIISLIMIRKKSILGEFILTGLFGYMLYTYMSYAFLMFYNGIFLLYVFNMALSFYGFVLCIINLHRKSVINVIKDNMPTKGLQRFLIFCGVAIFLMWSGRIFQGLIQGTVPEGLDNCTTLVIQAMDLGFIVPACFVVTYLLKTKNKLGYILGPVIIVKAATLVTAVLAMGICMRIKAAGGSLAEIIIFGIMTILSYYYFVITMKKLMISAI